VVGLVGSEELVWLVTSVLQHKSVLTLWQAEELLGWHVNTHRDSFIDAFFQTTGEVSIRSPEGIEIVPFDPVLQTREA
jgi:hypothetical protein